MRRSIFVAAAGMAVLAAAPSSQAAEFTKIKILPTELAIEAAETAIANCARGTVSIVDATGAERAFIVGDHSQTRVLLRSSRQKALTALYGGMPSLDMVKPAIATPGGMTAWALEHRGMAPGDGGVPIKVRGELIGAVGMSAPGTVAHVCAEKGIAKIQDRLNALQ